MVFSGTAFTLFPVISMPVSPTLLRAASNVKPKRFLKIIAFVFLLMSPKKSNIFIFETKFVIQPKCSLSDLNIAVQKPIDLFSFQNFFETTKSSVLFVEICELNQNVLVLLIFFLLISNILLLLKKVGTHQKFLVLFQNFGINRNVLLLPKKSWSTSKSFGFVPKFLE
jgi:hypothetical protein